MADAKYSVPFMVAFTLARGAPSLEGLADGVLDDPRSSVSLRGRMCARPFPTARAAPRTGDRRDGFAEREQRGRLPQTNG